MDAGVSVCMSVGVCACMGDCMCMCACICVCVCVYVCICVCVYASLCVFMHLCVCVCICVCVHVHTHRRITFLAKKGWVACGKGADLVGNLYVIFLLVLVQLCADSLWSLLFQQLSRACIAAMQRIMRQRALSVDLNPDIEDACMVELGDMCSEDKEDVEKGAVSAWRGGGG